MKKVTSIKSVNPFPVYDISVENDYCFELSNGIIAHNSMYPKKIISGGCLEKGTLIKMADNSNKAIEDILIGDMVSTLEGSKSVLHTWNPDTLTDGNPECITIEFEDNYSVTCSVDHPFLTTRGWVGANKLKMDDDIVSI